MCAKMRGPQYRPQNTMILIVGARQNGTLKFGKPTYRIQGFIMAYARMYRVHEIDMSPRSKFFL